MEEYLSGIAAILGMVLTAIGGLFAYRKSEMKHEKALVAAGRAGTVSTVAGLVMSQQDTLIYAEKWDILSRAVDRLARAEEDRNRIEREKVEPLERAAKESIRMGDSLEDIAGLMRQREKRLRDQGGV